jgi:hypothetical protein
MSSSKHHMVFGIFLVSGTTTSAATTFAGFEVESTSVGILVLIEEKSPEE